MRDDMCGRRSERGQAVDEMYENPETTLLRTKSIIHV